jgi:hypothetical protein
VAALTQHFPDIPDGENVKKFDGALVMGFLAVIGVHSRHPNGTRISLEILCAGAYTRAVCSLGQLMQR